MAKEGMRIEASLVALAAAVSVTASAPASADEDEVRVLPCRPTISCSADIVPPGAVEVEAGYAARRVVGGGYTEIEPVLLKVTLVRWLQLQAGTNALVYTLGTVPRRLDYVDDFTLGAKVHFSDQTPVLPSVAASASVNVPSFDRDPSLPLAYAGSFWGYLSKDFGSPGVPGSLHVDLNGGLDAWQLNLPQRSYQPFVALAFTEGLPWHFGAMAEAYAFADAGPVAPRDAGLLAAVSYAPEASVMFDAGADLSAYPGTRSFTVFAGVTLVPVRLWGGPRARPVTARAGPHPP